VKKKLTNILKVLAFFSIGAFLFWLVYRKQDFAAIWEVLKNAKYQWLLLSVSLGLLSHLSRSLRWKLLIKPLGYKPRTNVLFYSVMVMYLSNLAIPRSGEVVRCATVSKYEKVPFSSLLGTVVTERIIDMLMLLLLLVIVLLTQMGVIIDFLNRNPAIKGNLENLKSYLPLLGVIAVAGLVFIFIAYRNKEKLRKNKLADKIFGYLEQFWSGIKTVATLEDKWAFIGHTVFIWTMYFMMIYVDFKAFDATSHLNLAAGLTVFVIASFGMVAPSPGGIGTWHFMAIEALKIFGIKADPYGNAFAIAAHESQTLMLITVGLISLLALSFVRQKTNSKIHDNEQQK